MEFVIIAALFCGMAVIKPATVATKASSCC